jgi:glycosyltransferase involved in cell wall biosynthesis
VTFLGKVSDEVVEEEFARAAGFLFPGTDDFGITPVEAMAAGTPVIAYKAGGALDYVRPGVTGEFFAHQTAASLAATLKKFTPTAYSSAAIRACAQSYSIQTFHKRLTTYLSKVTK